VALGFRVVMGNGVAVDYDVTRWSVRERTLGYRKRDAWRGAGGTRLDEWAQYRRLAVASDLQRARHVV
jgi:hypothetical protein